MRSLLAACNHVVIRATLGLFCFKGVEEAVNREVMRETISEIQSRNRDLDADEIEKLIDEEVGDARKAFWSTPRR
ncbi:MAG: hypothetical protein JWL96_565 [Sphingomonas bacterium]|nr:hypothetical protein [Sphingomonas bacterium]